MIRSGHSTQGSRHLHERNAQFDDALANRYAIAIVARLELPQADTNAGLGHLVAHGFQPFREGFASVFALIPNKLYHAHTVV